MDARSATQRSTAATLSRVMAIFCLGLMASVWPLWLSSPEKLVQIPWWSLLCNVPGWVDQLALFVLASSLLSLILFSQSPHWRTAGLIGFVLSLGLLTALDQHRLQPWVCQFLLLGTLLLLAPERNCVSLCRVLIASIYFWSALSKLDVSFFESHGQLLLSGLLRPLGIETTYWTPRTRGLLTLTFPLGELLIAVVLLFRRTARIGLAASLGMHLLLIWTLGPGLHHEWSVLIWNAYFIVQNAVLFRAMKREFLPITHPGESPPVSPTRRWVAGIFCSLAALYPALELIGGCDHWPAWAVYSARPAQVRININEAALAKLPQDLRPYLGQQRPLEEEIPFRLEAWSFQNCACPIYPQTRYKLALALALLERVLPDDAWNVEIRQTPARLTGERNVVSLHDADEVRQYCRHFWGNRQRRLPPQAESG